MPTPTQPSAKAQHSPLPWTTKPGEAYGGRSDIKDASGRTVAVVHRLRNPSATAGPSYRYLWNEMDANAAHIVRCVNSHDALVAALKSSINEIEQLCSTVNTLAMRAGLGRKIHPEDFGAKARAALTLATH